MRKMFDYRCLECGASYTFLVEDSERDNVRECIHCDGGDVVRVPSAPNVLRATYPDGKVGGRRGENFRKLREASKLECEMMNLPPEKRGEHRKAIRELKEVKKGEDKWKG